MSIDLLIATIKIRLMAEGTIVLNPDERFSAFISQKGDEPDIVIHVNAISAMVPENATRVFDAPLMEESIAGPDFSGKPFWSVWRNEETVFVKVALQGSESEVLLVMDRGSNEWKLFMDMRTNVVDPLPYPLDGLIIYYLAMKKRAIMIHASAVNVDGRGWLFSGSSGNGKTTIAKLFDSQGIEVIHDDRVLLVREKGEWCVHSTPVYRNDVPRSVRIDHIWLIEHGKSNISTPVRGAMATALVLANCVQQNWDSDAVATLLSAVEELTSSVPVSRLRFVPDKEVCKYLLLREETFMSVTLDTAMTMLGEGFSVTITAGGKSMWPAIRPGDKVIIEPFSKNASLVKNDVIALIRDGGLVVHRIVAAPGEIYSGCYRTRGDNSLSADPLSGEEEIAGVVREIIRDGKRKKVSSRRMPYLISHILTLVGGVVSKLL